VNAPDDFDEPEWDDQMPERDVDDDADRHAERLADQAAEAYAALPWWRRVLVDYRARRSERRYWRRFRRDQREHLRAYRRGEDLPIPPNPEAPF
jgi:hypothetical protein